MALEEGVHKMNSRGNLGRPDSTKETLLTLEGVSARYTRDPVLRHVSLNVRKGEVICLLGSNGAGKTTTVRTILGLMRPYEGEVWFRGKNITGIAPHRAISLGIGIVPEGKRLFRKMSVTENVLMGISRATRREVVAERLAQMRARFPLLERMADRPAGLLSGGEQAQVAIARGLIGQPALLILDEPSLGLSPALCKEVFKIVRTVADQGTTVLLIEQNLRQTVMVSDRGYLLQKGVVVASGTTEQLLEDSEVQKAYFFEGPRQ
jgi:branched-chain amino acid transport system ATP-binding protein